MVKPPLAWTILPVTAVNMVKQLINRALGNRALVFMMILYYGWFGYYDDHQY